MAVVLYASAAALVIESKEQRSQLAPSVCNQELFERLLAVGGRAAAFEAWCAGAVASVAGRLRYMNVGHHENE